TKYASRRYNILWQIFQRTDEGYHHQGQKELKQTEEDGSFSKEDAYGFVREAEYHQGLVNDTGAPKYNDPGVGTGNGRNHQWQNNQPDHTSLCSGRQRNNRVGRCIADDCSSSGYN